MLMYPSLLIIVKDLEKEEDEDDRKKRNLQETRITRLWGKKEVDLGCIIMYKAICDNCNGNGHINITDSKGVTETKQCWMCNSEGEIKYEEDFINKLITNHRHRLQ
jgi:hypothetical protein